MHGRIHKTGLRRATLRSLRTANLLASRCTDSLVRTTSKASLPLAILIANEDHVGYLFRSTRVP